MAIEPLGNVLHNVTVHADGRKFVQKPKVIETIDLNKLKYVPPETKSAKATGIAGFFGKIGKSIKKGASKLGYGLRKAGNALTKTKGGKAGLIAAGIGAVLLGAGMLLSKCSGNDDSSAVTPTPNEPETPVEPPKPPVTPALPGENDGGNWGAVIEDKDFEMLCRDASGRTRDIKGELEVKPDFEKNPDEFTITDKSSGEAHAYKYKKIGVTDDGKPIYKCVSMNDREATTENQYTLEWDDENTPKLMQYKNQDNYGTGLKFGKLTQKEAPGAETKPGEKVKETKEMTEVWLNRQPGPGRQPFTLEGTKKEVILKCQQKRPLTEEEQKKINECENEVQIKQYLETIGIKLRIAY